MSIRGAGWIVPKSKPTPRPSRIVRAVHALGDTADRRADSLLAELPADNAPALMEVLLRRLGG
jgi:hypothetical protein